MPDLPVEHKWTAVTKGGFEITSVWAANELDARIKAADEMKVPPLRKYFDGWAHDGYRMIDRGVIE